MHDALDKKWSAPVRRLASGIEAGVVGGAAMLATLVSSSLLRGHAWWEVPNLLGSTFYGSRAFRLGASMATVSGTAFHFVMTGTVGGLFGLACGGVRQRRRLVLLGILAGVVWYYLAAAVFWNHINPLVPAYSAQPVTAFSHALFGACLGWMGQRFHAGTEEPEPEIPGESSGPVEESSISRS